MFTLFDILVFTIIIASTMLGSQRGFVRIFINIIVIVVSLFAADLPYLIFKDFFGKYFSNQLAAFTASVAAAYIFPSIIFGTIGSKFYRLIRFMCGGTIDKTFGLFLGIARGVVICLIIFSAMTIFYSKSYVGARSMSDIIAATNVNKCPWWLKSSMTFEYIRSTGQSVLDLIPKNFLDNIKIPNQLGADGIGNIYDDEIDNYIPDENSSDILP